MFVAVADSHGRYLVKEERFPRRKGVRDSQRDRHRAVPSAPAEFRAAQPLGDSARTGGRHRGPLGRREEPRDVSGSGGARPPRGSASPIRDRRRRAAPRGVAAASATAWHCRRRPLPRLAQRRAGSAVAAGRVSADVAHRGQSGFDSGSLRLGRAGRFHAGRLGARNGSRRERVPRRAGRRRRHGRLHATALPRAGVRQGDGHGRPPVRHSALVGRADGSPVRELD